MTDKELVTRGNQFIARVYEIADTEFPDLDITGMKRGSLGRLSAIILDVSEARPKERGEMCECRCLEVRTRLPL